MDIVIKSSDSEGLSALRKLINSAKGKRLERVCYSISLGGDSRFPDSRAHEVDHAVIIDFNGLGVRVSWSADGYREGLIVEASLLEFESLGDSIREYDVSEVGMWQRLQGCALESLTFSSYRPDGESQPIPWAARFDLACAPSFVIALGEVVEGEITYYPHSLVVIFDETLARAYKPILDSSASWG